jgi:Flp pilus assembly protein TadD
MLYYSSDSPAAEWLNKAIPKVTDQFGRKITLFLQPPSKQRLDKIVRLVQNKPLKDIRVELDSFLDENRAYAYQTGDSHYLTRTFSNIGYKTFKQDADYALVLVEEAAAWEPNNPFLWSERAVIEAFRGNPSRAEAILWEARRRFPEDPAIRSDLAKLLGRRKKYRTAEALYRQTMEDFPKNDVCRNGLAEVLKEQGKLGEAESVYRQTMENFPKDDVCRSGLAEVLKDQGKLGEAESLYRQTMEDFPGDVVCRTGLAVVLVKLDKRDEAISLLEKTVEKFPKNKVAKGFLEKIKGGQTISTEDEKKLEKQIDQPVKEEKITPKPEEEISEADEFFLETPPMGIVAEPAVQYNKEVEIGDIESKIGKVALERWLSARMEEAEKEEYQIETAAALGSILEKAPDNIPALLLKGLWLADQDPGEAEKYLSLHARLRPNTIGFHLMELRVKGQQNNTLAEDQWNQLSRGFPSRATLIKLEHALYALEHTNGSGKPLKQLEQLRKQLSKGHRHLPPSLQKNEEWVLNSIQKGLFKDVDTTQQVTAKTFETLESNFQRMKPIYRNTVEQCVSAAI